MKTMKSNLIKDIVHVCSLEQDQGRHAGAPTMLNYQSKVLSFQKPRWYLPPPRSGSWRCFSIL